MNDLINSNVRFSGNSSWLDVTLDRFRAGSGGRAWLARVGFILAFALFLASAGCDVLNFERTAFPDALVSADGQEVLLEDVAAILNDSTLNDDQKRESLRELGIEDEDLLDALLTA